jgi:exo-beta-1,3-glucanase (GH17 family)
VAVSVACILLAATAMLVTFSSQPAAAGTVVASTPATWYFAEGYTGSGFQEYLCVANPSASTASVDAMFMFKGGGSQHETFTVKPLSRYTVDVNATVGQDREVSVVLSSLERGLVVERPIYFTYHGKWRGSHCVFAANAASRSWFFAEGYTGGSFDEYVCALNPGNAAASLTFRFQTRASGEVIKHASVGARSRATFKVNDLLGPGVESALSLESDRPIVAERPMYFDYVNGSGAHWQGGHCVMGAPSLDTRWCFAEGTTRPGFDEWLTIQNPGSAPIDVKAAYQLGPGQGGPVSRSYRLQAMQRVTVLVPAEVGRDKDVSVVLWSASRFLAERPTYYSFDHNGLSFQGAHCALGTPSSQTEKFFAEGYTGKYFEEWITLQNSSDSPASVEVDYLTQELGALPPRTINVGARSRVTVFVNENAGPNYQLASRVRVVKGTGVVAERPMYFDSSKWQMPTPVVRNTLYGVCFSPYLHEDPTTGGSVTASEVASLLDSVARYSGWIRTFGSEGEWDAMPELARSRNIKVAGGCDIYTDRTRNASEVAALVQQAGARRIDMAVVGDEVLLGNVMSSQELIGYIRQVRAAGVPTGTSDSWDAWLAHPELIAECDIVLMNIYPYWEGMSVEESAAYVASCYEQVKRAAGGKTVIVETGWPSAGQVNGSAVPSQQNAMRYLADFTSWARASGAPYFYFEAFDEPWKASREGTCGAYWGLWDSNAALKPGVSSVMTPRQ